jgi:hypothetical protein
MSEGMLYLKFPQLWTPAQITTYSTQLNTSMYFKIFTNRGTGNMPDGAFGECILCEDVTTTTRQKIEGYLAWKWGLAANLPGGHPYEFGPP